MIIVTTFGLVNSYCYFAVLIIITIIATFVITFMTMTVTGLAQPPFEVQGRLRSCKG